MNYDRDDLDPLAWRLRETARRLYRMRTTEEINEDDDRVAAFLKRNMDGARLSMRLAAEAEGARDD